MSQMRLSLEGDGGAERPGRGACALGNLVAVRLGAQQVILLDYPKCHCMTFFPLGWFVFSRDGY